MEYTRTATEEDCLFLAPRLREADVQEIKACSGEPPLAALLRGLRYSDTCFTLLLPGTDVPFAMAGVLPYPYEPIVGGVWMLATDALEHAKLPFLRRCQIVVDAMNHRWPVLTNVVDERNFTHIKWLKWLGFTFIRRHPTFGVAGIPFLEFVRIPTDV